MKIALLLLCYNKINDHILDLLDNTNISLFIHPKGKLDLKWHPYIIPKIIPTKWGDMSIVNATINLLDYAMKHYDYDYDYDYYILISGDSYPIYDIMTPILKKYKGLSVFDKMPGNILKASQWFALNNADAKIIVKTRIKYKNLITNNPNIGAPDELYFINVLHKEKIHYVNGVIMYVNWPRGLSTKHPVQFNSLYPWHHKQIKKTNALFVRKCLPNYTHAIIPPRKILYLVYVGTRTDQKLLCNNIKNIDCIILTPLENNLLADDIMHYAKEIHFFHYSYYEKYLRQLLLSDIYIGYAQINIIPEKYLWNTDPLIFYNEFYKKGH